VSMRNRRRVLLVMMVVVTAGSAAAASVTLPTFQLLTRGILDGGQFELGTQADVDIAFGGGYKFGGQLALSIASANLELPTTLGPAYDPATLQAALDERLSLSSASVIVRDLFGAPIDLTYFIGEYDRFVNGDVFPDRFGTDPVGSFYRGLLYFPDSVSYDGTHLADGTGIAIALRGLTDWFYLDGAVYQDAYLGRGYYSTDMRAAVNFQAFKAEAYVGASFPQTPLGTYRAGLLLYYAPIPATHFLAEVGVPRFAPGSGEVFSLEDVLIRFEPRVYVGIVSLAVSILWHPEFYLNQPTGEGGESDMVVRLVAGNINENVISGGVEGAAHLPSGFATENLEVVAAPFVTIASSGVLWDFKVNFNVLPFSVSDLFEAYIGVRTEF
jgi:hypothetical protein